MNKLILRKKYYCNTFACRTFRNAPRSATPPSLGRASRSSTSAVSLPLIPHLYSSVTVARAHNWRRRKRREIDDLSAGSIVVFYYFVVIASSVGYFNGRDSGMVGFIGQAPDKLGKMCCE